MCRIITIISLLVIIMMVVTSCDDRAIEKPEINVAFSLDTLYYLVNYANESADILIELTSDNIDTIANRRIDVHYNTDMANVITNATATGNLSYFVTDENGVATGSVYARKIGNLQITFTATDFKEVTITKSIRILGPTIDKVEADPSIIPADDITLSEIKAYTKPPVSGLNVEWSADWGTLIERTTITDVNGVATTWAKSDSEGFANITAKLVDYPENPKIIQIEYTYYEE